MIAVTVSTNYSDILPFILEANRKYFTNWIFVTDRNDHTTIGILSKEPTVTILYWDFQNSGKRFDKGGALAYAQGYAYETFPNDWYLIVDSDICLSEEFATINVNELNPELLYGCHNRWDFLDINDYRNNINFTEYRRHNFPIGFFQLYKQKHYYRSFDTAGNCDDEFVNRCFPQKYGMFDQFVCRHLGKDATNWAGRVVGSDFFTDQSPQVARKLNKLKKSKNR